MRTLRYGSSAYTIDYGYPKQYCLPDYGKSKCTYPQIMDLLIVLEIFGISRMIGLKEIPAFQTLSRRSRMVDLLAINGEIILLY